MKEIINKQYDCEMCKKCKYRFCFQDKKFDTVMICTAGVQNNSSGCGFIEEGIPQYVSTDEYYRLTEEVKNKSSKMRLQLMNLANQARKYSEMIINEIDYNYCIDDELNTKRIRAAARIILGEAKGAKLVVDENKVK